MTCFWLLALVRFEYQNKHSSKGSIVTLAQQVRFNTVQAMQAALVTPETVRVPDLDSIRNAAAMRRGAGW